MPPPSPPIDCPCCQALLEAIDHAETLSQMAVDLARPGRARTLMSRVRQGLAAVRREALAGTLVEGSDE